MRQAPGRAGDRDGEGDGDGDGVGAGDGDGVGAGAVAATWQTFAVPGAGSLPKKALSHRPAPPSTTFSIHTDPAP